MLTNIEDIQVTLSPIERSALRELLDNLSDRLSCAGCNDMRIDTSDQKAFEEFREAVGCWGDEDDDDDGTYIIQDSGGTMDFEILHYFQKKFGVAE